MANVIQPFHLLVITLAGWLNHHQQAVIDYLIEEIGAFVLRSRPSDLHRITCMRRITIFDGKCGSEALHVISAGFCCKCCVSTVVGKSKANMIHISFA